MATIVNRYQKFHQDSWLLIMLLWLSLEVVSYCSWQICGYSGIDCRNESEKGVVLR